jgi:hypothetical protein
MSQAHEWADWESGDCVCAPDRPGACLARGEILRRVAVGFRRVVIDWTEGDRWVEARIAKATEIRFPEVLLEAEYALLGQCVLVSVVDEAGPAAAWVRFYMTPDTAVLELHYDPADAEPRCRQLGIKLAEIIGYEYLPREADAG